MADFLDLTINDLLGETEETIIFKDSDILRSFF